MAVVGSGGSVLVQHVLVQQLRMAGMFTPRGHRVTAMFTPWGHRVTLRLGLGFIRTDIPVTLLTPHCNPSCQPTRCSVHDLALSLVCTQLTRTLLTSYLTKCYLSVFVSFHEHVRENHKRDHSWESDGRGLLLI